MDVKKRPCDRDIACRDAGTYDLSGTKVMTVDVLGCISDLKDRMSEKGHPEHKMALCENIRPFFIAIK